jgi:hypothetical protein
LLSQRIPDWVRKQHADQLCPDQGKQVVAPMIEPKLHLLEVQRKVLATDTMILPQTLFGVAPEALDAVDMALIPPAGPHVFDTVIDRPVFALAFQRLIAAEAVRVEDGAQDRKQ